MKKLANYTRNVCYRWSLKHSRTLSQYFQSLGAELLLVAECQWNHKTAVTGGNAVFSLDRAKNYSVKVQNFTDNKGIDIHSRKNPRNLNIFVTKQAICENEINLETEWVSSLLLHFWVSYRAVKNLSQTNYLLQISRTIHNNLLAIISEVTYVL